MIKRILMATTAGLLMAALAACGGGDDDAGNGETATPSPASTAAPVTAEDLARTVVQILPLDGSGTAVWHGSGTFISAGGLILTNAHVVDDRFGEYETLGVAVTLRTDEPPDLRYAAEIEAVDYALDLALIRVVSELGGGPVQDRCDDRRRPQPRTIGPRSPGVRTPEKGAPFGSDESGLDGVKWHGNRRGYPPEFTAVWGRDPEGGLYGSVPAGAGLQRQQDHGGNRPSGNRNRSRDKGADHSRRD